MSVREENLIHWITPTLGLGLGLICRLLALDIKRGERGVRVPWVQMQGVGEDIVAL